MVTILGLAAIVTVEMDDVVLEVVDILEDVRVTSAISRVEAVVAASTLKQH